MLQVMQVSQLRSERQRKALGQIQREAPGGIDRLCFPLQMGCYSAPEASSGHLISTRHHTFSSVASRMSQKKMLDDKRDSLIALFLFLSRWTILYLYKTSSYPLPASLQEATERKETQ